MSKDQAKVAIQKLIEKYQREQENSKIKKYSEEETKQGFILPLFGALGWDVYDRNEVTAEEQISGDRVDYGFYLNGRTKFYLEAKPFKADLHKEEYAKQAIKYSWNKGVTWAVLCDFEGLIVFNALSPEKTLSGKQYLAFKHTEYLGRFEELWRLSKEAFSQDVLDREAEKVGKKQQKVSVTETLSKDLNECRKELTEGLRICNPTLDANLIDEGVQKLLNRLIFIRVAEDRKIEPSTLIPLRNQWIANKRKGTLFASMVDKFREFDKTYNSSLFQEYAFEKWEEYHGSTEKVIDILYGTKNYFEYDFSIIPADVLGNVYENYLGFKLEQSKKDLFGQDLELSKNLRKRKEHGIYYTPKFIVDYIVQNALGPVLDKCKSINDLQKIKILDPACGSGSFLVAAFNTIVKKWEDITDRTADIWAKIQILEGNIYGVDLDEQAVELARLNLLLQAVDSQIKLPNLGKNIKSGNSLISGTDEELKKFFGSNFRDKKPFNWQEEFPEVFKQGGFDVIIGNPPYLDSEEMVKSQQEVRSFFTKKYKSARGNWDLFILFSELGLELLNKNGRLGLIIPNKLLSAPYAQEARKLIAGQNVQLIKDYSNTKVFSAGVYPIVLVVAKSNPDSKSNFTAELSSGVQTRVSNLTLTSSSEKGWSFIFNDGNNFQKLFQKYKTIADYFQLSSAATVSEAYDLKTILKDEQNGEVFKLINTGTVDPYISLWGVNSTTYIKATYQQPTVLKKDLKELMPKRYEVAKLPKIIVGGMNKEVEAFFDSTGEYLAGKSTAVITGKNKDLKFLLGILNSRLFSSIYKNTYQSLSMQGGYLNISASLLSKMPIPKPQDGTKLVEIVDSILDLQHRLNEYAENSNEWQKLKDEIAKTDHKIDQEVYKLYGLTDEEIKVVEGK